MFFLYFRTLEARATRLFETKNKAIEDLDPSFFMKDKKNKKEKFVFTCRQETAFENRTAIRFSLSSKESSRHKEIAGMEAQIFRLVELLNDQRKATSENVRRKQALAGGVSDDSDDAADDVPDDDSDTEADGLIYNPKNLPLGWDGKVR